MGYRLYATAPKPHCRTCGRELALAQAAVSDGPETKRMVQGARTNFGTHGQCSDCAATPLKRMIPTP